MPTKSTKKRKRPFINFQQRDVIAMTGLTVVIAANITDTNVSQCTPGMCVAVKTCVLNPQIKNEIAMLQKIHHPNVVKFFMATEPNNNNNNTTNNNNNNKTRNIPAPLPKISIVQELCMTRDVYWFVENLGRFSVDVSCCLLYTSPSPRD